MPTAEQLLLAAPNAGEILVFLSRSRTQRPAVRQNATVLIGRVLTPDGRQRLLELLRDEQADRGLRRAAVQALDGLLADDKLLRAAAEDRLVDPAPSVARAAVLVLANVSESRSRLEELAAADPPPVVRTALEAVLGLPTEPLVVPVAVPIPRPERRDRR